MSDTPREIADRFGGPGWERELLKRQVEAFGRSQHTAGRVQMREEAAKRVKKLGCSYGAAADVADIIRALPDEGKP